MEAAVELKLKALAELQKIDSSLDEISKVRGDLPNEVRDLEDEIIGLETRLQNHKDEIENSKEEIKRSKAKIKDCQALIKKYEGQQLKVKNNREYDALTKEIEMQNLEILSCEKKMSESEAGINTKTVELDETNALLQGRKADLKEKKGELENIIKETEKEEDKLKKASTKAEKDVDERLLHAYKKVRASMRNGLAIVSVKRGACGGCFNMVPPQRQAEIRQMIKIIVCEHCGRILVDESALN